MTMPDERTRAVCRTRDFLHRLASPYGGGIKGIPKAVREEARRLARHYPAWFDLSRADAFDEAAAIRYGEQETGEDWLREMGKPITKPMPKRKRA